MMLLFSASASCVAVSDVVCYTLDADSFGRIICDGLLESHDYEKRNLPEVVRLTTHINKYRHLLSGITNLDKEKSRIGQTLAKLMTAFTPDAKEEDIIERNTQHLLNFK